MFAYTLKTQIYQTMPRNAADNLICIHVCAKHVLMSHEQLQECMYTKHAENAVVGPAQLG